MVPGQGILYGGRAPHPSSFPRHATMFLHPEGGLVHLSTHKHERRHGSMNQCQHFVASKLRRFEMTTKVVQATHIDREEQSKSWMDFPVVWFHQKPRSKA